MLVLSVLLVLLVGVVGTAAVESTSVSLTLDPTSICVGGAIWCTATVTNTASDPQNGTPQGTVSFSSDGAGYFSTTPATLSGGTCAVWYTPTSPNGSPHTITATYNSSDAGKWQDGTLDTANVTVNWCVDVQVMGSETPLVVGDWTWVTATVVETSGAGPTPTGSITFSRVNGDDDGTFFDGTGCTLEAGTCMVKYRADSIDTGEIHELKAHFDGSGAYASSDTDGYYDQVVTRRQADVVMTLSTTTAYIYQPVTVTVRVGDDTTAGTGLTPSGSVTFSDGGKNGVFSLDSTTLSAGQCTVTYTPHENDAGVITITATYAGSAVHDGASIAEDLVAELRPTRVTVTGSTNPLYVRQSYGFTVTVEDIAGPGTGTSPNPTGSLAYSSTLPPADVQFTPTSGSAPSATFSYLCLGLDWAQGYDVVKATYTPNDGIHAAPEGSENNRAFGQGVRQRDTVTSITNVVTSSSGATFTSETVEKSGLGPTPYPLTGTLTLLAPNTAAGALGPADTLSHDFTVTSDSPFLNVTVRYESTDRVHLASFGSANIDRSSYYAPGVLPDNPTDYDNCTDGCGTGGTNVENAIYALNSTEAALTAAKMVLDAVALVLDVIPDPVTAAGCIVVGGATIPASDIAAAVVAGAGIAIDIAIAAMDTDLDDDGIPDSIESTITHTYPNDWDSDNDGMGDLDEIDEAGGYYGGTRRPDPKDSDSDDDKLLDGDEANLTHTDFCVADTDCDTVSDGVEASTGKLFSGLPAPSADIRDQADPLVQDTDGDGLRDDLEIAYGCPYVNDDDSDDDGIQDGYEDADHSGTITNTIGTSTTQGSGETSYCVADTDADGLLDGEEEGMFGKSVTPKDVSPTVGVEGANLGATVPALDPDMDNDGLSDYAEVSTYQTDPMDADTDDDTLSDGAEIATYAYIDSRDHSNPREDDTDGDGLTDDKEIAVGCPFVNDDDSDDDGLQDGTESWDGNATCDTKTIGNSTLQSSTSPTGETLFCDPDTDDDGLTDGEEVALLGGLPVSRPTGFTTVVPKGVSIVFGVNGSPLTATVPALDDDSDNDGLSDYEEVSITHTDPLDQDSDNDTLSDANELIATTGSAWPRRSFVQVSDPLDPDSDDDGLPDQIEYPGSGLGTSRASGGVPDNECPYVDDDDSDDDGLQDGTEDANHDGTWGVAGLGITPGNWGSQATKSVEYWETNLCDPDTDDDGLTDGEEVGLLGGGPGPGLSRPRAVPGFVTVTPEAASTELPAGTGPAGSPPGTKNSQLGPYTFTPLAGDAYAATIPALDSDSDNDGLSDYEEVNATSTDPLDQDTDNDTLKDSDELVATGGTWPQRTFDQESDPLDVNTDDDHLFDPQEFPGSGLSAVAPPVAPAGSRDVACPFVNDDDSDDDGIQDGKAVHVNPALTVTGSGTPYDYSYTHYEDFVDIGDASLPFPGKACANVGDFDGEQQADAPCCTLNVCDSDSDGDGLNDGEEVALGTNPDDCDTDDDGRNDWHEVTGGGPIPTDPFDPDTDDDGLLDSAEVFGLNPTNPVNADTDGDGLCDGGAGTPWMMTPGDVRVVVNPLCKSCSTPGLAPCAAGGVRAGSASGIGDHPNPSGYGEDKDGDGEWDGSIGQTWGSGAPGSPETDPNQYDTDGDADGDGIEVLGFSTSRAYLIPPADLFGRPITVQYPSCGCLQPLIADTDQDGLEDGYEDRNHDGNFDFLPSEFDHQDPLPGPPIPYPTETNPCDPDTDHDQLTDFEERNQRQPLDFYPPLPVDNDGDLMVDEDRIDGIDNDGDGLVDEDPPEAPIELTFNPTNPLDHDTDNDWIYDGPEVHWVCVALTYSTLDNDTDGRIDEDPIDGLDNDFDGLIDEDPVDFTIRFVPMLDPTNRDSDSDGFIDGLDDDPCNSELIPLLAPVQGEPVDSDGDGFSDLDEVAAGTHPNGPEDHPVAYCQADLDFDGSIDDRIWLEPSVCCGQANSVVIDLDNNVLIDLRLVILPRNAKQGDFDGDGSKDDLRYTLEYGLSNYRVSQPRVLATIDDYNGDLVIDHVLVERK